MSIDVEGAGNAAGDPPKIKAETNRWYLLATLYGVPGDNDKPLQQKNRIAWNRYFAAHLEADIRTLLVQAGRHSKEELTPFSPEELQEMAIAFAGRCNTPGTEGLLPPGSAGIDFSHVEFEQFAFFEGYLFKSASFKDASFRAEAEFLGATFLGEADFDGVACAGWASFDKASFWGDAGFHRAIFSGDAYYQNAAFKGRIFFTGTVFSGDADFTGANFAAGAVFDGAVFSGESQMGAPPVNRFMNAEMKGLASFEGASFEHEPPLFLGAKLHQGVVWRDTAWPKPKDSKNAGRFLDSYAWLTADMQRIHHFEDAHRFFALELQARRKKLGPWRGWPISAYGLVSNYGRSLTRPLLALIVVAAIGAFAFWHFDARSYEEALALSLANALNVFGVRTDLLADTPVIWLKVLGLVQTLFGILFLFLFGLGLRNRFRMK